MCKHKQISRTLLFVTALCILAMGLIPAAVAAEDETEILKITVGEPTLLDPSRPRGEASVAISRTGTVAAFFAKSGDGAKFYRISKDAGRTWGPERDFLPEYVVMSVGLRDGGVLFMTGEAAPVDKTDPPKLQAKRIVFSDDFLEYEISNSAVSIPQAALQTRWGRGNWPVFCDGKIIQLDNGDLLATMYGDLQGDTKYRTMIVRSTDQGRSWQLHSTVAYNPNDPHPFLVGFFCGYCEPSLALLPNGQLLCMMRTQGAAVAGEYRPMYLCWSEDLGKTWTKPVPTEPHLMNVAPVLAVLDNGVVACEYGRPGFHVAFSLDNGHTWQNRISFSDLTDDHITGYYDIVKVGPNKLVVIGVGSDGQGTKVWPITVQRLKVSRTHALLEGQVLDQQGNPVAGATVERGPNRYVLDSWLEDETKLDRANLPVTVGSPGLGYRSIQKQHGQPAVQTDAQGRFHFGEVKLNEYVLTVEAEGYAPQHRHIKVEPQPNTQDFRLKPGRKICNRVIDNTGRPVPGACVVLNRWHVHTDGAGFFHWSVEAPLPEQVKIRVYKRYAGQRKDKRYSEQYETLKTTLSFSQLERQPITLNNK